MTMVSVSCQWMRQTAFCRPQRRMEAEVAKRERLAAGELGMDIYNFREPLAAKGLKYE